MTEHNAESLSIAQMELNSENSFSTLTTTISSNGTANIKQEQCTGLVGFPLRRFFVVAHKGAELG